MSTAEKGGAYFREDYSTMCSAMRKGTTWDKFYFLYIIIAKMCGRLLFFTFFLFFSLLENVDFWLHSVHRVAVCKL